MAKRAQKNGIMFQYFEWYLPADGTLWNRLAADAKSLAEKGVTAVWIPPAYKGTSDQDVGYGVYDLYDLGEFDQKGTVRTKYGTKEELMRAIVALHECDIAVYADVVLNHKAGADFTEAFHAVKVNPQNRQEEIAEAQEIEAWTGFDFPGRGNVFSDFKWRWHHFSGVDFDQRTGEQAIFRILGDGKGWSQDTSDELGNYDYLMFADIDHKHPEVESELLSWSEWFINELDLDGFRLDAVKHISSSFMHKLVETVRRKHPGFYFVGEYWQDNLEETSGYLKDTRYIIDLFDVALHFNFMEAGQNPDTYDLRKIFDGTQVQKSPMQAVTFVDNHDSQPGQSLESFVSAAFKESAYALILLRKDGYPCVFYGDYYGSESEPPIPPYKEKLDKMLLLRRHYAHGEQIEYFEDEHVIGWVRKGDRAHPEGMAVVMTLRNGEQCLRMDVGREAAGTVFADFLGNHDDRIIIEEDGCANFPVHGGRVSCWLQDGLPLDDFIVEDFDVEDIQVDADEPLKEQVLPSVKDGI